MAFVPGFLLLLLTLGCSLCLYKASVAFSRSHLLLSPFIETLDSSHILISTYCMLVYSFSPVHLIMSPVVKAIIKCNVAFGQELSVHQWLGLFWILVYSSISPVFLDYSQYQLSQVGSFQSRDGSFGWKLLLPRGGAIGGWP